MNLEAMDEELRSWAYEVDTYWHPEICKRCKKKLRVPHSDIMVLRGWLFCSTCKEFFKRTTS